MLCEVQLKPKYRLCLECDPAENENEVHFSVFGMYFSVKPPPFMLVSFGWKIMKNTAVLQ